MIQESKSPFEARPMRDLSRPVTRSTMHLVVLPNGAHLQRRRDAEASHATIFLPGVARSRSSDTAVFSSAVELLVARVEWYLRHRSRKQSIQPGDRAALKRLLSVLRETGTIAPAMLPPLTPHEQIFKAFSHYLREERGLATKSIVRHLPFIRLFLREVCPGGVSDLGKISQADVTRYIERHARDWSAGSGKAMCGPLRSFLRYLHHKGLNPPPPTYLV